MLLSVSHSAEGVICATRYFSLNKTSTFRIDHWAYMNKRYIWQYSMKINGFRTIIFYTVFVLFSWKNS